MPVRLICASHSPLMDHVEADPGDDRRVRETFAALREEIADYAPELVVVFAPDHFKGFFYDVLPSFTVGVRAHALGDYGIGSGPLDVPEDLALDCLAACREAKVDAAISYRMAVDHGFSQILTLLGGSVKCWPTIPIHVNCAGPPLPTMDRVRAIGNAVGHWAAGLDKRVLFLGSGGLSHDPPIPSISEASPLVAAKLIDNRACTPEEHRAREESNYEAGRELAAGRGDRLPLNPEWDIAFMRAVGHGDLASLDPLSEKQLTGIAGCGGHEVRCWIAAYAALAASGPYVSERLLYRDIPAWNAGMGIVRAAPKKKNELVAA